MSAREDLLDRCLDWLQHNGFGGSSLREIAAGVGSSHRMLIYHFGSRDALLAAVVSRVEAAQLEALRALSDEDDLTTASLRFWQAVSDPALEPAERMFFEVYAAALHERNWSASFRTAAIDAWEEPVSGMFRQHGFTDAEARARARLALAATRGLLQDLLLTGERHRVDAAAHALAELLAAPPRAR